MNPRYIKGWVRKIDKILSIKKFSLPKLTFGFKN
jgi:hypothetical protein